MPGPDGKLIHAALDINGSMVMLNDDFPEMTGGKSMTPKPLGGTPVTIHMQFADDVDARFQRALDAGATVIAPLEDQFWGDRYGVVRDPFGHQWSLAQTVREVTWRRSPSPWVRARDPGSPSRVGAPRASERGGSGEHVGDRR